MNAQTRSRARRSWFAPEVVQTSAMDCGPASLTCLLAGYGIPVSYGRLREACQTDVDGTSIDTIEVVANELGVRADQVMIPVEHLFLDQAPVFPALVVVRHADGPTHFVVVWRRIGAWLQVMDPSIGRRWVRCRQFAGELFRHETSIPAAEWRAWAATDESLVPLREILSRLGAGDATASQLIDRASADEGWFAFGALDASTRLVEQVIEAGGVKAGAEAVRLLTALFQKTCDNTLDIFKIIPPDYWSVSPDPKSVDPSRQRLLLRGAVLLQVSGRTAGAAHPRAINAKDCPPLSPELAAALNERPPSPLASLWGLLKSDGILAPLTLMGAMCLAAGATLIEALLFRGIFDIGALLNLGSQRLVAVLGLLTFMGLMLAFRFPIVSESLRFGRRLETRLRMALLQKMPQLTDRYFQSRPISDMADRNHSIQISRILPGMGVTLVQSLCALILTLCGIALIDSISAAWALGIALCAIVIPGVFQPMINERYLRARNHYGALNGFYLDALLGLVPIRVHRAELAVRYRHEGLLVEWVRSCRRLIRASVLADGLQSALCLGLACALLVEHFIRSEGVTGADLLLVYWTLNLSALGRTISALAHQYPVQRNVLLRLLEPLAAPAGIPPSTAGRVQPAAGEQSHVTEPPHSQRYLPLAAGLSDVVVRKAPRFRLPLPACGERVRVRGPHHESEPAERPPHPALRADLSIARRRRAFTPWWQAGRGGECGTARPHAIALPADGAGVHVRIENGMVTAAGHTILRNLDLTVARGEHVAIVGLSGAGKSSLIGLLLGWHRLAEGRLLVDGAELTEDSLNALRRSTAWVDPAIQIWNKSFLDNLNYSSRDSDLVRAGSAIDSAHLREVLQKLPHGLQTPLGEGGALLSGGEGQRVRLGRALVQSDVRLALLDEPFRGMDREQRSGLLSDARRHWGDATLLCVTHDVSETLSFDRVLVIEDWMIREDDRPSRLAGRPSRYRELLDAEQLVRDRMWAGKQWRHIRIENGVVAHDR